MELEYVFLAIILVCVSVLVIYLIIKNKKDKDEVIRFFNETEVKDESKFNDEDVE